MDPLSAVILVGGCFFLSLEFVNMTVFTLSMQHTAYLNFNMFGMRILCTESPELNVKLIRKVCINNKLINLLKLDRTKLVITGNLLKNKDNVGVQKYIESKMTKTDISESDEVGNLANQLVDSKMYNTAEDLCLELCDYINIALFTINDRKHAKLSLYANDVTGQSHWILLVDSNQALKLVDSKQPSKPDEKVTSPFSKLGILTANTNLYAFDTDIEDKSVLTFPHEVFMTIMNKYKPEIILDRYKFTEKFTINNGITKDRAYHFLKNHSNIRRAVRNVRVLKDDHVTLSRTSTAQPKPKKITIGSRFRNFFNASRK